MRRLLSLTLCALVALPGLAIHVCWCSDALASEAHCGAATIEQAPSSCCSMAPKPEVAAGLTSPCECPTIRASSAPVPRAESGPPEVLASDCVFAPRLELRSRPPPRPDRSGHRTTVLPPGPPIFLLNSVLLR